MFDFFVGHSSAFFVRYVYTDAWDVIGPSYTTPVDQKFLTKDIFFREFELKKMGEGLKEA